MTQEEIIELACQTFGGIIKKEERKNFLAFAKLVAEKAIKEALSQPEQEPVAWEQFYPDIGKLQLTHPPQGIYYTPPQRKPLTDEQINQIADEFIVNYRIPAGSHYDFAKSIEAAHKIKE